MGDAFSVTFILSWLSLRHVITFKTRRKKIDNIIVKIIDTEVKQVESTKVLGIYIDSNLTWKTHIKHITTKIAKTTGILFKARHFLPSQTIRTLYYSLLYPYLNYGNMGKYLSGLFHFQILQIIHVQFLKIYLFYQLMT